MITVPEFVSFLQASVVIYYLFYVSNFCVVYFYLSSLEVAKKSGATKKYRHITSNTLLENKPQLCDLLSLRKTVYS